jgi:hypothetical protein
MSELREAAQAAPDAEVRAQHKKFARWFLELSDKSALASEYLAWLAWKAALAHPPRNEWREAAEEALRWMEHARLHLTIKERMHPDGLSLYDSAAEALRAALAQPKTELRDQHKAFTHWYFGLRGINEANFSPEDLAWAAWKAALAQPETAEPPRDEWRPASEPPEDGRR